jgi:hypothetical protein
MSFIPKDQDRGKIKTLPMGVSAVATKWGLMKMSSGYLVAGAAADDEVEYVIPIDETMIIDAHCGTTPVQATHVGNNYDIASVSTVDLTGTTDKVFHIDSIIDATNKIVRGRFNKPAIA